MSVAFKKDGETKVFVSKTGENLKTASEEEKVRYTVDDLVEDSEKEEKEKSKK